MADVPPRLRRLDATAPVVVGLANQNIVTNFRRSADGEVHLPPLRALARMVYDGRDFLDLYVLDLPTDGDEQP